MDPLKTIFKKIILLNDTTFLSMAEKNDTAIIKNFTETGIKILDADFGFSWWKKDESGEYKLAYKSPNTPYQPFLPREKGGHFMALKTKKPFFDSDVKKENYGTSNISPFMKSYIIIPMFYKNYLYGALTICYKNKHNFTDEELVLASTIGNSAAQAITIHRFLEKAEKQKEVEVLLKQEKLKSEFLANATHEFRTPLAIIRGTADLALRSKTQREKEMESALKEVNNEVVNLSAIIADLVTLIFQGEGTEGVLTLTPVDLGEIINHASKRLKILLDAKNISLKSSPGQGKLLVMGDKEYLDKLLINLIRNAITYGKENGKIEITVKKEQDKIMIKISDNGVGIAKDELPYIFERFYRTKKAREMSNIGTGLGLAISKWVVESHRGNIAVESTEGKGTTFTITLPLLKP